MTPPEDPRWRLRVRLPHRLGPLPRTGPEVVGIGALLVAAAVLGWASVVSRERNGVLLFPAFGIPDLLLAWFRLRRFRMPARWATDVRAAALLTTLTAYLVVSALRKEHGTAPLAGVLVAAGLGFAAAGVWIAEVVRSRPR